MVGNWIEFGNPLYSVVWTSDIELNAMGKAELPATWRAMSALTFAVQTVRGMNLLVGAMAILGAAIALLTGDRSRVWLIPLVGVSGLLMLSIFRGSLAMKVPYTLTIGTMLLPFVAMVCKRLGLESWSARRSAVSALVLLGALAGLSVLVSWERYVTGQYKRFSLGAMPRVLTISSVPMIENQAVALTLPGVIRDSFGGEDEGLITDFYGWGATSYVALSTRVHPHRLFMAPGAPGWTLDLDLLSDFLERYPRGVIVLLANSRFTEALGVTPSSQARVGERGLTLRPVHSVEWPPLPGGADAALLQVFRYQVDGT
jgi:hypothetical protein